MPFLLERVDSCVGWVERSETHHCFRGKGDGFRFALPMLRFRRLGEIRGP
jgi:hypothetical protein